MKISICPVLFLLVFAAASSCTDKDPLCGDPIPSVFNLILLDTNDSLLVGTRYPSDSISLWVSDKALSIFAGNGEIAIPFYGLEAYNNLDYYLRLEPEDTDTLRLFLRSTHTPCWNSTVLDSLYYNNRLASKLQSGSFIVLKP